MCGRSLVPRSHRPLRLLAGLAAGAFLLVLLSTSGSVTASASRVGGIRGCAAAVRLPSRPLRVGLVLNGPVTASVNAIAYRGLQRAVRVLRIEGRALEQGPKENGEASLAYLARQGFDLVVGFSLDLDALDVAARQFPETCFLSLDAPNDAFPHKPRNLLGIVFRAEEPAYLAGYLAATIEHRRPGRHVVSTVGGISFPPVNSFIAGFQAGARKADPNVTLLNGYSDDFVNPSPCRRVALQQIGRGSGVVFQVAGICGLGALEAAKEKGAWAIGVDEDQSSLGPFVLTSVLKNFDVALFAAIRSLQRRTFLTGTTVEMGLRDDGVGLGTFSPRVPRALIAKLDQLRRQIIAGRIAVPQTLSP